jgi:predicted DNA-binding transcriptional regulator AlpA
MPPPPRPNVTLEDRFLRLSEIARLMDLSERSIHRFVVDPLHPLPVQRFGRAVRVRQSDFEHWLRERRHDPPASSASALAPFVPTRAVRRMAAALRGVPFNPDEE